MKFKVVDNVFSKKLARSSQMQSENLESMQLLKKGRELIRKKMGLKEKLLNSLQNTLETKNHYLSVYDELKRGPPASTKSHLRDNHSIYHSSSGKFSQLNELEKIIEQSELL